MRIIEAGELPYKLASASKFNVLTSLILKIHDWSIHWFYICTAYSYCFKPACYLFYNMNNFQNVLHINTLFFSIVNGGFSDWGESRAITWTASAASSFPCMKLWNMLQNPWKCMKDVGTSTEAAYPSSSWRYGNTATLSYNDPRSDEHR